MQGVRSADFGVLIESGWSYFMRHRPGKYVQAVRIFLPTHSAAIFQIPPVSRLARAVSSVIPLARFRRNRLVLFRDEFRIVLRVTFVRTESEILDDARNCFQKNTAADHKGLHAWLQ